MKRILTGILVLLAVVPAWGQIETYPMTGYGRMVGSDMKPMNGFFVGADMAAYTDTVRGLAGYFREGYIYGENVEQGELQGAISGAYVEKTVGLWEAASLSALMGSFVQIVIEEGADEMDVWLFTALNVNIWKPGNSKIAFGLESGVMFSPKTETADRFFPYVMLNLTPRL